MQGAIALRKSQRDEQLAVAYNTAALSALARAGKLKPLSTYLRKPGQKQTPDEMLAALRAIQSGGAPMKITEIKR